MRRATPTRALSRSIVKREGDRVRFSRARRWQRVRHALRARSGPARHGGAGPAPGRGLRIDSEPGRGTTIAAELPCGSPKEIGPKHDAAIRILLADDHTVVRDGLRALLEKQPDMAWWAKPPTAASAYGWPKSNRPTW